MSVRVKLDNKERGYYASLYQAVDATNTGQIGGAQAVSFFKRSGLSIEILKKIWLISSPNNQTLNKEEFYVALKLISYAQNNIDVSNDSIQRCIPSPLPQFQSDTEEVYKLRPEQERLYQNYIQQLDHSNSTVSTQMAMNLFKKTNLTQFQLQNIINLVDPNLQTKPRMTTHSYIVITHLISLASQNVPIPQKLPNSLQEYLNQQLLVSQNLNINNPPINPQPSVVPKSNDLMDFEANFDTSKSPIDKYSAFNYIEMPNPIIETTVQKQQQPQLTTSQSFKIPAAQTQQPVLKQQKSIDLIMNDVDSQPQLQQITQPIVPQQQVASLQSTTISQQVSQQPKKTIDFQKQVLLQEQMQIQQQQLEQNFKEANDLLNEFKESHEKILISSQSQLESLQTTNEQYKTLLKKISDENYLFQEELKQIEQQKKKLTESLSKQAIEINQKLGLNIQLKQEYSKQTTSTINAVTDYANQIIGDLRSNYEIEQERKRRQEQEIIKEMKQQKDQMSLIFEALGSLSKDIKSQRKNSTPYQPIDTHETQNTFVPFQQVAQSQQIKTNQIPQDQQEFREVMDIKFDNIEFPKLKLQEQQQEQIKQVDLDNKEQFDVFSLYKDNQHKDLSNQVVQLEQNEQKQQVEQFEQQQIKSQEVEDFVFTESQQPPQVKLEDKIEFENNMIGFDNDVGFINKNNEDQLEINQQQEQQINVQFDQSKQFEEQEEIEHKVFDLKFEDGFGAHFDNRNSIEQNPSINFDQNFVFEQGTKQVDEVQIDFDANKEFGGNDWTGFADNFAKGSPQQKDDFQSFKW
ncbi:unnamed protein product (macronuclear) [Paramecium tetraurelia]|uniref:EH domain-containing protein n=1 Tax=Paramecium tetraurelia TaxID=5888 RepID=A0DDW4_PARTE|nr:uncharacterized protein GSPATT00016072001 [Paramecium tetraurelia]CAK81231.1 unnamed protein product [Paramecium tetraurelia]|eukprot:XP_001448628.1 hypothetical protein (macronuclear) [Paramecium tetraurelia strain d4-2]